MNPSHKASEDADRYDEAEPDQHGNVFERIKFLVTAMEEGVKDKLSMPDHEFDRLHDELAKELSCLRDGAPALNLPSLTSTCAPASLKP